MKKTTRKQEQRVGNKKMEAKNTCTPLSQGEVQF